jgi:flagellar hook-associated protein 3 FlgL
MRIGTNTVFDLGVDSIQRQTARLLELQQQISVNRRILVPSDDPVGSARALEITQADAINTQYGTNSQNAGGRLALTESALGQAVGLLQSARESVIQSGDGSLSDADRRSLATSLRSMREELLSLSNTSDGEGNYLFSGYQTAVKPFTMAAAGVQYNGDDGERLLQISSGRQVAVSASGADAFMRIRQGNGNFVVAADAANAGNVTYSAGNVTNASALTGNDYRIEFTVVANPPPQAPTVTYDVVNTTTAAAVLTAQPFTSGQAIGFDGMQVVLDGAPANGDAITVAPSANQDIFATLENLADALEQGALTDADRAKLTNALTDAVVNIDQGIDHLTSLQGVFGARMREADTAKDTGESLGIQYKSSLSQIQDLDYAKAVSDLIRAQTNLQAAQQTFVQTSRLSIFDYI